MQRTLFMARDVAKILPVRVGTKKEPRYLRNGVQIGDDILSQDFVLVPSALVSLTSLFGMGRGGPHRNSHLKL